MEFENAILEYRLKKGSNEFEPIYYYPDIDLGEILARRECEFFVKNGTTYKQLSSGIENQLFVIYVEIYEEEPPLEKIEMTKSTVSLEIRELNARKNYPLITMKHYNNHFDILSVIGSVYTYYDEKEWERDSAEIDEDRKTYILYVSSTGYEC
ncbi:hypothetical protein [Ureibacillus endophyticus]|uniref:Uncharacterized protein n=1 Tax=Ureibacillus endophyticus TaxID=1978490 RepID=A0A494YRQ2_9BACL|nr:hypothetical protein [Lysinibacillus endophyticus]RKQ11983.1 hypothetical protein D8M03_17365 [Lysinibacillus endophyticus]